MSEWSSSWVSTGSAEKCFGRTDVALSDPDYLFELPDDVKLAAAPFGGPIVAIDERNNVDVRSASLSPIARWRLSVPSRVLVAGWSAQERPVFVSEDGQVLVCSLFGALVSSFSMGQEARELKVAEAKVFTGVIDSRMCTGVAIFTHSSRLFVVSNVEEPRVRRFPIDAAFVPDTNLWDVSVRDRQTRVIVANNESHEIVVATQSESRTINIRNNENVVNNDDVVALKVSFDNNMFALLYNNGLLWIGSMERKRNAFNLDLKTSESTNIAWCGNESVLIFSPDSSGCELVTLAANETTNLFMADFLTAVQEPDGCRILTRFSHELIHELPKTVVSAFSIGSVSPSSVLRLAGDELGRGSYKADEYCRMIDQADMETAVMDCIECATHSFDPNVQKSLLRAAQLGKTFINKSDTDHVSNHMAQTCLILRLLNNLRLPRIGLFMSVIQLKLLSIETMIDRLLARRLFPVAQEVCRLLRLDETRILAHWASFKVETADENETEKLSELIANKLGEDASVSYADIAFKAAQVGKTNLALKLIKKERSAAKQVPLLVKLGNQAEALDIAMNYGDRNIAFVVLMHLKNQLSMTDFLLLLRKYPSALTLYKRMLQNEQADNDTLMDTMEEQYALKAEQCFKEAYETQRSEARLNRLVRAQEQWRRQGSENNFGLMFVEENMRLLRTQINLEANAAQTPMDGLTLNQTVSTLLQQNKIKQAEKLKNEFKMGERRFAVLRVKAFVSRNQISELKRFLKDKKQQPLTREEVVRLVHRRWGPMMAKRLVSNELFNINEQFTLYSDMELVREAADVAVKARNIEWLKEVSQICVGKRELEAYVEQCKEQVIKTPAGAR